MTDPLDDIIAEYEREMRESVAHEGLLSTKATALVCDWTKKLTPILNEMNTKVQQFNRRLGIAKKSYSSGGTAAGATVEISCDPRVPPDDTSSRLRKSSKPTSPHLVLTLTARGTVQVSLKDAEPTPPTAEEIAMPETFPEAEIRKHLAEFVGYCLGLPTLKAQRAEQGR